MQTDTFTNLLTLTKGLTGNTAFTAEETVLVSAFINRRLYNAYRRNQHWPRYLVTGEARAISAGVVPFTQATLNPIDTFFRIYKEAPYGTYSVPELTFYATANGASLVSPPDDVTTVYVDYKKRWDGDYNTTTNTQVPQEFFQYAAHGAFADFLRYDGQNEKAAAEDAYAESLLMLELENVMNQRNFNTVGKRIRSHSSTQSRHSTIR
jgi:hypothetical protein